MAKSSSEPMANVEHSMGVVTFLGTVQPLCGCDYTNDERMRRGDQLVREFAAAELLGKDEPDLTLKDAADVLYLMHNIEPMEGLQVFDGETAHLGYVQILSWVESRLRGERKGARRKGR